MSTGRMTLSFHSPIMEERRDKEIGVTGFVGGSLEERKEAFREDEELMRKTTKFVSEVIETAATEASKRKFESEPGETSEGSRLKPTAAAGDPIGQWNNRARGFCNRILNALCPCFTNNELFAWTPYRYRFTRP